jgi:hypothetical protein
MAMITNEIRTRPGACPTHGQVTAEKQVPKLKFPFVITGVARSLAAARPYRCPNCGTKTSANA